MRISDWSSDVCSSDLLCRWPWAGKLQGLSGPAQDAERSRFWRSPAPHARHFPHTSGGAGGVSGALQISDGGRISGHQHQPISLAEAACANAQEHLRRSEEHTSELQSLMRISYAVFCLKKKKTTNKQQE